MFLYHFPSSEVWEGRKEAKEGGRWIEDIKSGQKRKSICKLIERQKPSFSEKSQRSFLHLDTRADDNAKFSL